jgi:hypothetical protein
VTQDSMAIAPVDSFYDLGNMADVGVGMREAQVIVEMTPATVPIPQVQGVPVGEIASQSRWVKMIQLELADRHDLLYPNFNYDQPLTDPNFEAYCNALQNRGDKTEPLHVLPISKIVRFQGRDLPMFAVYDDPIQFIAMQLSASSRAKIIIELDMHPGELLLQALSRTQHLYRPTVLDLCDVAARLESYGYSQEAIATHLAKDSDTGSSISQGAVSRMIGVSRLPEEVRVLMLLPKPNYLTRSHAELLIVGKLASLPQQQINLARWVLQPPTHRVNELKSAIDLCFPDTGKPQGHIEVHANGSIEIIDDHLSIALTSDRRKPPMTSYPAMTPIQPMEITRTIQTVHGGARVVVAQNGDIGVDPTSFNSLMAWMKNAPKQEAAPSLHDTEVMVYAWIEALRANARDQKLLTQSGKIAPIVPKTTIVER